MFRWFPEWLVAHAPSTLVWRLLHLPRAVLTSKPVWTVLGIFQTDTFRWSLSDGILLSSQLHTNPVPSHGSEKKKKISTRTLNIFFGLFLFVLFFLLLLLLFLFYFIFRD